MTREKRETTAYAAKQAAFHLGRKKMKHTALALALASTSARAVAEVTLQYTAEIDATHCQSQPCPSGLLHTHATGSISYDPLLVNGTPFYTLGLTMAYAPLGLDLDFTTSGFDDGIAWGEQEFLQVGGYLLFDGHFGTWNLRLENIDGPNFVDGLLRPLAEYEVNDF